MVVGQVGETERSLGLVGVHAVPASFLDALRRRGRRVFAFVASVHVAEQHNVSRLSASWRAWIGKQGESSSVSDRLHVRRTLASFVHYPQPDVAPSSRRGRENEGVLDEKEDRVSW
jgi:hypothetical protein